MAGKVRRILSAVLYVCYLVIVIGIALAAAEYGARSINLSRGKSWPFFVDPAVSVQKPLPPQSAPIRYVDPHLGYARGPSQKLQGFTVFGDQSVDSLRIVTLGGSTTDSLLYDSSWPEDLYDLLKSAGIRATIYNGAVAGYSSSQGLVKMIRDGLVLKPDIVITYDGINDMGQFGVPEHLFVHPYQLTILEAIAARKPFRYFPNLLHLIDDWMDRQRSGGRGLVEGFVLGVNDPAGPGERWMRNIDVMYAVARGFGIHFLEVLQPVAGFGAYKPEADQREKLNSRGPEYTAILDRTYRRAIDHSKETDYILNLSDIFASSTEVFLWDGIHLTPKGNAVIAKAMFDELSKRQWLQKK